MMEVVWQIMLIVCMNVNCIDQPVEEYSSEKECIKGLEFYEQFPKDRNSKWDRVEYICKPKGSRST
tara:strand:+ start:6540 stop:6737 length:198 start_codon:yes stop_codon:yes gene_type:complete